MWCHTYKFSYDAYETWNLKWFLTFCCNRCILTEGETDKIHPAQNLPDKRPPDKTPGQKYPRAIEREFVQGLLSGFSVLGLLKIGGRDLWCTFGRYRDVWQSVTGGGGQNWQKIVWLTLWTAPERYSVPAIPRAPIQYSISYYSVSLAYQCVCLIRGVHAFIYLSTCQCVCRWPCYVGIDQKELQAWELTAMNSAYRPCSYNRIH